MDEGDVGVTCVEGWSRNRDRCEMKSVKEFSRYGENGGSKACARKETHLVRGVERKIGVKPGTVEVG